MRPRWGTGIWLGKRTKSDEHLIWDDNAVHRSRAVKNLPEDEAWDLDAVNSVSKYTWNYTVDGEEKDEEFQEQQERQHGPIFPDEAPRESPELQPPPEPIRRSMKIQEKHLRQFGYTASCPKCHELMWGIKIHSRPLRGMQGEGVQSNGEESRAVVKISTSKGETRAQSSRGSRRRPRYGCPCADSGNRA